MASTNGNNTGGLGGFPRGRPGPVGLLKQDPRIGRALRRFSGTQWPVDEATLKINNAGRYYVADVTGVPGAGGGLSWVSITKTFTDFAAAALTNTINLYTLAAGGTIIASRIKHATLFSGGGIATYKLSGIGTTTGAGDTQKYYTNPGAGGFDIKQATGDHVGCIFVVSGQQGLENQTATNQITATATSQGANLDQATQGSVTIWLLVGIAA